MIVKRIAAVSMALGLAAALGGCGGYIADRVPHWAGGLPADVPPRPGAPGYQEFIAHGEPTANVATPDAAATAGATTESTTGAANGTTSTGNAAQANSAANKSRNGAQAGRVQAAPGEPVFQQRSVAREAQQAPEAPAAEPVANPPAEDTSVVKGGLY